MKLFCAPRGVPLPPGADLQVVLFGQPDRNSEGARLSASAGEAAAHEIRRQRYDPAPMAWDMLALALSVVAADVCVPRDTSPDGWTRQIELTVAVGEPDVWNSQAARIEAALRFLSTDIWTVRFVNGGYRPAPPNSLIAPANDCVCLLSGGMDSLIGAIDLVTGGLNPLAVSNVVRGDGDNQQQFAARIGLPRLALNHNASPPSDVYKEPSQRARSLIFLAFAIAGATALQRYRNGEQVPVFVCENGFIALNPPLTGTRLGSLSTRTAHPEFLQGVQAVLDAVGLRVSLVNPYQFKTKGEMARECLNQSTLGELAGASISCGRYRVFNYQQCGRCVPCQVRRAAFLAWGQDDPTPYRFSPLGQRDGDHARFDDVRSVAMAIMRVREEGLEAWLGSALSYPNTGDRSALADLISRGLAELKDFQQHFGVL